MVDGAAKPWWSGRTKMIGLALFGGLVGYASADATMSLVGHGGRFAALAGAEAALLIALIYVVMGAFVGLAALSPRIGAALLNVEDADEVREEAASLRLSGLGCLLLGASLAAFALGGPGGPVAPVPAAVLGFATLLLAALVSWAILRRADELMRAVSRDTAVAAYYLYFAVMGSWAVLAHLGFAAPPRMIDLLAALWGLTLLATFWVAGRRGMLRARS